MGRRAVVGICALGSALAVEGSALAQSVPAACDAVQEHRRDTVIVFQPPSSFTICRDGSIETGVGTDRSVYLQLSPNAAAPRMFDFRVRKNAGEWTPLGLRGWETRASEITGKLRELDHSGEPIADVVVPVDIPPPTPLGTLATARTRYLADVTPRYLEALHAVRSEARELPVLAGIARRWCGALAAQPPGVLPAEVEVRAMCSAPDLREGAIEKAVWDFESAAVKESTESSHARDATLAAVAHPEDGKAVNDAVRALEDARGAAEAVVSAGHALRESSAALARDVALLRATVRSIDALRPNIPVYLAMYSTAGNAELEIEATPSDVAGTDSDAAHSSKGNVTGRFPIYGRHYLDIEVGLGWTAGVPDSPYVQTIQGNQVIQTKPVDEFVGFALVELEPLRFAWPERPLAGLLRMPVIAIPFTRDPTSNFFVGGGLGWTGVGSVTAGPYFYRETTLRQGFYDNETLPSGVPFGAVTVPGLHVGYFLSASVNLVGLYHLIVPSRAPTIDGLTGKPK